MAIRACASAFFGLDCANCTGSTTRERTIRYEVEKAMGPALVISLNEDG